MTSRGLGFAVLLASALALGACSTVTNPGAPDQSFDIDQDIQDLEAYFKQGPTITDFYASPTVKGRDEFISGRLTLMNIQYIKFIRRFAVEKAQLDTAADILIIGVNLAGTLVGAASTKGILAAISGGTAASRTSINKNFFHEKTVPVLITAMNAERKEALVPIVDGIGKTLDEYPFAQALSDLNFYYHAGTFIGALQAVQKDSGVKEDAADRKIIVIKRNIALAKKEARDRVSALLDKIDALADDDAMAMAKNPPVVGDEVIDAGLKARDPGNNKPWLTDPIVAKQALKFMLSLTSFADLTKWETVLK